MQPSGQEGFVPLYDGARVDTGQLKEGMGYKDLRSTVVIFLVNEDTFPEQERSRWRFLLKDESIGGRSCCLTAGCRPSTSRSPNFPRYQKH